MMLELCDKYKQALIGLLIVTIEEFCHRMKLSNLVPANNEFDDIVFSSTGQAIIEFFSYFDKQFKGVNRTVKMHLLERHTMEWMHRYGIGFGLMGEQGIDAIHSKCTTEHMPRCRTKFKGFKA